MVKIRIHEVSKIFGPYPRQAIELIKKGSSHAEVYQKTHGVVAVDHVSFDVLPGETLVIMGLSGSGKSTLVRCLNGLYPVSHGSILIDGENITLMREAELLRIRRRKFGMIFQNFGLFPHRNVLNNVAYGLEIQGVSKKIREAKALEALELVNLKKVSHFAISQLSGGMQQRVGIARALAVDPDILLMDEAFSALDPLVRYEMQEELVRLKKHLQKTIVFITHDLDEALKLGDRIVLMQDARLVQIGRPQDLILFPVNSYVKQFVRRVDVAKVLRLGDILEPLESVRDEEVGDDPLFTLDRNVSSVLPFLAEHSSLFVYDEHRVRKGLVRRQKVLKLYQQEGGS